MAISISEWLNGDRLYSEGVKLYTHYGTDSFLKAALSGPYSKTLHQKLVDALIKLEKAPESKPVNKYALPSDLEDLQSKVNNKYSELRLIHAELPKQVNQATRKEMCRQIIEGFAWIDSCYDIINHYRATGKRMDTEQKPVSESAWTLKRITDGVKLIPANLTKTRDKLKKETDANRIKVLNERLATWESEYAFIQKLLSEYGDTVIYDAKA